MYSSSPETSIMVKHIAPGLGQPRMSGKLTSFVMLGKKLNSMSVSFLIYKSVSKGKMRCNASKGLNTVYSTYWLNNSSYN